MPSCGGKEAKQTLALESKRKQFTYEKIELVFQDYRQAAESCVASGQQQMIQEREGLLCRRHL